jgi:hypothetical protein
LAFAIAIRWKSKTSKFRKLWPRYWLKTSEKTCLLFCEGETKAYQIGSEKTRKPGTWMKRGNDLPNIKGVPVEVGRDYQCRCVARDVFTLEGFANVPVAAVDWDKKDNFITYQSVQSNKKRRPALLG